MGWSEHDGLAAWHRLHNVVSGNNRKRPYHQLATTSDVKDYQPCVRHLEDAYDLFTVCSSRQGRCCQRTVSHASAWRVKALPLLLSVLCSCRTEQVVWKNRHTNVQIPNERQITSWRCHLLSKGPPHQDWEPLSRMFTSSLGYQGTEEAKIVRSPAHQFASSPNYLVLPTPAHQSTSSPTQLNTSLAHELTRSLNHHIFMSPGHQITTSQDRFVTSLLYKSSGQKSLQSSCPMPIQAMHHHQSTACHSSTRLTSTAPIDRSLHHQSADLQSTTRLTLRTPLVSPLHHQSADLYTTIRLMGWCWAFQQGKASPFPASAAAGVPDLQ